MRLFLLYSLVFILAFSARTTTTPQSVPLATKQAQQDLYTELLKKVTNSTVLDKTTLGGRKFVAPVLLELVTSLQKKQTKCLSAKKIDALLKGFLKFYKKIEKKKPYNIYFLRNEKAPTRSFDGEDIPETVQFGQGLCVSILILELLIHTRSDNGKAIKRLEKIVSALSTKYDHNNPTTPHFVEQGLETIIDFILTSSETDTASSTDASSDDSSSDN